MDPQPTTEDFLKAETCLQILSQNLALSFQLHGQEWDRQTMQQHVNDRTALLRVQEMLINEAERIHAH